MYLHQQLDICDRLTRSRQVDVRIDDKFNGNGVYMTALFAGSVGMDFTASGDHGEELDTAHPVVGWWAYLIEVLEAPKTGASETGARNESSSGKSALSELKAQSLEGDQSMFEMWKLMAVEG